MAQLKQIHKNYYQAYRQTHSKTPHHGSEKSKTYRDWWSIKARGDSLKGVIPIVHISTPPELVGKKIEIFVRVKE